MSQEPEPVGSLAEEAAKFLHALQSLGEERDRTTSSLAEVLQGVNEHIATGAQECAYCPICQAISAVRQINPEVRAHLASAATSLVKALAGLLEPPRPDEQPTTSEEEPR